MPEPGEQPGHGGQVTLENVYKESIEARQPPRQRRRHEPGKPEKRAELSRTGQCPPTWSWEQVPDVGAPPDFGRLKLVEYGRHLKLSNSLKEQAGGSFFSPPLVPAI